MIYAKQSTAVTVLVGPFVDSTDGATAETGLTVTQAEVRLSKNGGNMAQKNESTSLAHDELGFYTCLLDATDTNTLGMLKVAIYESGALTVWEDVAVVTANWWDTMFSTDQLDVNVTNVAGTAQTANDNGADINAILADTNELQADDTPGALAAIDGKIDTIDGIVDAILVDTGTTLQAEVDAIQAAVITNAAGVDIAADIIAVKAETATIVADTNELQADDTPTALSGIETKIDTIDGIVDAILVDTGTTLDGKLNAQDAIITEARLAELDAANLPADIAAIPTDAEINAEVVDCLNVDTYAEPGQGAPAATNSIVGKLGYVFKFLRNKIVTSATEIDVFNDAGAVVDQKSTISDDGTDMTRGEFVSGP